MYKGHILEKTFREAKRDFRVSGIAHGGSSLKILKEGEGKMLLRIGGTCGWSGMHGNIYTSPELCLIEVLKLSEIEYRILEEESFPYNKKNSTEVLKVAIEKYNNV